MIPGQQSLILEVLLCVLNVGALYNKLHWVQHLPHRYGTPMSNFPIVSQYQVMVSHWIPWCQLIMLAAGQAISVAQPPANTSESPGHLCIWKMQKVFILPQRSPGEADPSTSSRSFDGYWTQHNWPLMIPSGEHSNWKWPLLMGKSTINGHFQ